MKVNTEEKLFAYSSLESVCDIFINNFPTLKGLTLEPLVDSELLSDKSKEKIMATLLISQFYGAKPEFAMDNAAKVMLVLRLSFAAWCMRESMKQHPGKRMTRREAAIELAHACTIEWHRSAVKWIISQLDVTAKIRLKIQKYSILNDENFGLAEHIVGEAYRFEKAINQHANPS